MSCANITPPAPRQDDRDDDGLDIPDFLKITAADRRLAWERNPSRPMPAFGREMSATERAYRASIEREKAAKRAADEVRFKAMRAKAATEKAERDSVKRAVAREIPSTWAEPPRRGRPRTKGKRPARITPTSMAIT